MFERLEYLLKNLKKSQGGENKHHTHYVLFSKTILKCQVLFSQMFLNGNQIHTNVSSAAIVIGP